MKSRCPGFFLGVNYSLQTKILLGSKTTIMTQNELKTTTNYAQVGEAISHDLAAKMVKDYQDACPTETEFFFIGKDIINQILSQQGCVGIRFYNAIDETGKHTLVYVGYDIKGEIIVEYSVVDNNGRLSRVEALVGDRSGTGTETTTTNSWFSK